MQCAEVEQLLYLHRTGELSSGEMTEIAEHLETCHECRAKRKELSQMDAVFEVFRENAPIPKDSGALIAKIVSSASTEAATNKLIPHWLTERFVRMILAAILGLLAATFVVEQAISLEKIASLEAKMSQQASGGTSTDSPWGKLATLYPGVLLESFTASDIRKFDKMKPRHISSGQAIIRLSARIPLINQKKMQHMLRANVGYSRIELLKSAYRFSVQEGAK